MQTEIIDKDFQLSIHGLSGIAANKDYAGTAFSLMGKMWEVVKSNGFKNKGLNIWVYEPNEKVFAGVELEDTPVQYTGLEQKNIILKKYAYYKHVGPYKLIKDAGLRMREEILGNGFEIISPYIEIYGHWTNDESKLETELLMCVR